VSLELVRTYSADGAGLSIIGSVRAAIVDIYSARYVIWRLFVRDFVAQFRQKVFGYFWAVLSPLLAIASFVFMMRTGYLNPGAIDIPYPLFVYIGTGLWGIMIATLQTVSGGLLSNGDLLMRTSVPPIALAVAGLAGLFYSVLINTVVLVLVLLFVGYVPSPAIVLYPVLMLPLIVLGLGMGLVLAVVGTVARDLTTVVISLFTLLMYVTPVVYEAKFGNPILKAIVNYNPMTYLIEFPRNLVTLGKPEPLMPFVYSSLMTMLVLVLGIHGFYLIKDKVVERL
jgi:ABC-type polysaccharide/polyol phosphate export permease